MSSHPNPDELELVLAIQADLARAQETIQLERALAESDVLHSIAALLQSIQADGRMRSANA